MHEKNIPYIFWGKVVNTSVYLLNRCPIKALDKKTPFEVFSGRKPSAKHLRVFGSVCYTLIPYQLRHKLEKSSNKGVLVGYGTIEPETYEEAKKDKAWKKVMKEELEMIKKNDTWELVNRPSDKLVIGVKWVYKTKLNLDGSVQKNKARLVAKGFQKSPSEATLYTKTESNNKTLIVSIYVDDVVYTGNDATMIEEFKEEMMKRYEMTDLGLLHHFLGIGVIQEANNIFIHQRKYAETLLEKFGLKGCKPVSTPLIANEKLKKDDGNESADASLYKSIVGSLLYLTATRPDLIFSASLLSRFMQNPSKIHMGTAKRVLRYVQGTLDYRIKHEMGKSTILIGFCDSDWGGSKDDSISTLGYAFTFGSGVFSWASMKQQSVALSTAEVE
ncbi:uncharacterized mitochondrial protein AtMg00810-like [Malus domestica]|uniref:uncharacterized mitochondrial protein AtMg00810-like n=1 Tax=Malus domestica TaxID=3750 RepID=UPI0039762BDF